MELNLDSTRTYCNLCSFKTLDSAFKTCHTSSQSTIWTQPSSAVQPSVTLEILMYWR
jgi:hypothetical protein